jgi:hypothetical protein
MRFELHAPLNPEESEAQVSVDLGQPLILPWSVISRPPEGEVSTIDLAVRFSKA